MSIVSVLIYLSCYLFAPRFFKPPAGRFPVFCSETLRLWQVCLSDFSTFREGPQIFPLIQTKSILQRSEKIKLRNSYVELLFDFSKFFTKNFCFTAADVNFLFEYLGSALEHLYALIFTDIITYSVALMLSYDTL